MSLVFYSISRRASLRESKQNQQEVHDQEVEVEAEAEAVSRTKKKKRKNRTKSYTARDAIKTQNSNNTVNFQKIEIT